WSSRAAEHLRLLPGISDTRAKVTAIPDQRGERLRKMVEIEDEVRDVLTGEPSDDSSGDRFSRDGNGGLRPHVGQRPEPRAEARCQDECMRNHSDALLGVEEHVRARHSLLLTV